MRSNPTRVHLLLLFLLFLIVAGNVAPAAGIDHYQYQAKDKSAYARFDFTDASGCIASTIFVIANENMVQSPNFDGYSGAYISASLHVIDQCDGWRTLSSSYGEQVLEPRMVQFKGALVGVTAAADVVLEDWIRGGTQTLKIDLTWTGMGLSWSGRQTGTYQGATYRYTYRSVGTSRDAEATATIFLDGAALFSGPAGYAELLNSRNSYMELVRN
jgi:hypothetical protein